jgi:hypothetical protein
MQALCLPLIKASLENYPVDIEAAAQALAALYSPRKPVPGVRPRSGNKCY